MSLSQNGPFNGSESSSTQAMQTRERKEYLTQKPADNSGGREKGETQALECLSDDNEPISSSLSEPIPAGEQPPQAVHINRDGFQAGATAADDGRININIDSSARRFSKLFAPALQNELQRGTESVPPYSPLAGDAIGIPTPRLNVVIQIVGSRGDVQPFISLGLALKQVGHRVRIATHPTFQAFVEDSGLEFFNLGGDPAELMAYMVKNPGLMPSFETVRKGEVQKRRKDMRDVFNRCWRSCIEAGNGLDPVLLESCKDLKPFVADAIISNPPAFAHIHCAEKLGIPLHLMFTMPWSATQAFAHPLANISSTNENPLISNYMSYLLVEMMTWQGLGDIVNRFRRKVLGLEPIDPTGVPGMITRLGIPQTYCWSPALIPKPTDWGQNITIAGFYFLPLASSYSPSPELLSFLEAGPPPIYIGFGSIVVADPDALTATVFKAIKIANVRALVSKGWGTIGGSSAVTSPSVFMLGNCPHDWLFEHVSCVIHHGGAGTTAAGIAAGKPTVIVPFFGDQPFWGDMVATARAGPRPIHSKLLTASNLAAAIIEALQPATKENARMLGLQISKERGTDIGAKSFHDRLPLSVMNCSVTPLRTAVWTMGKKKIRLSALAATVLSKAGLLDVRQLKLSRHCEYDLNHGPCDPVTGATLASVDLFYDIFKGMGEIGSGIKNNIELAKDEQQAHDPTRAFVPRNIDHKVDRQSTAKGLSRIGKAAVRSPMTLAVGMAQGAHNVPKMWGDKTVRPHEKITGFGSGLKAGVKELTYGTYDGVTGLFKEPVIGAREEGALGATKGVGKGVAGAIFKPIGGVVAVLGYSMKGIDVEINKGAKQKSFDPIVSARILQGELEYLEVSEEDQKEIIEQWYIKVALTQVLQKGKERKPKKLKSKDHMGSGKGEKGTEKAK